MKKTFEIKTEYNRTFIKNKKIFLLFDVNTYNLGDKSVSKKELEEELNNKILKNEKKYITLDKFSNKQATYKFDIDKWLEVSTGEFLNSVDRFEKKIRIKNLPFMITRYVNLASFDSAVNSAFRNFAEKNKKLKNKILNIAVGINKPSLSFFKFSYDGHFKVMNIILKNEFRTNIPRKINTSKGKNFNFDSSVQTLLKISNEIKKRTK